MVPINFIRGSEINGLKVMRSLLIFFLVILSSPLNAQSDSQNTAAERKPLILPALNAPYKRPVAFLFEEAPRSDDPKRNHLEQQFLMHIATDQVDFIRGAGRFRVKDLRWALPLAGASGVTLATDPDASRNLAGNNPDHWKTQSNISDIGLLTSGALAGGAYLWGVTSHDAHKRETGVLAIEAATNAVLDNEVIKQIFRRDRPTVGTGEGLFFNSPTKFPSDAGFVSGHAMISWSIASVIAHEYPGWLTQTAAYGLATMTSATRVTGKKHFPSDVLIGSALGWYIGHQVYRSHHNPDLEGVDLGTFKKEDVPDGKAHDPSWMATPSVPLDSWVYAAFDRLTAMGYMGTATSGARPWTRMECARLLKEAEDTFENLVPEDPGVPLFRALEKEFAVDLKLLDGRRNQQVRLESAYTRVLGISGEPLTDSYHFGQTDFNDFGRPYREGFNNYTGLSADAEVGPIGFYLRGEYQHTPSASALGADVRSAIAASDGLPVAPALPFHEINRVLLLDSYVALNLHNWQFSFGKQSLWWGPTQGGVLHFSDNAEPITMLRLARAIPFQLPSVLGYLGKIRTDVFLGQVRGHEFLKLGPTFVLTGSSGHMVDPQPYMWGGKLNLKMTPHFEVGVGLTAIFAGQGRPLTFDTFFHTFSPHGNNQAVDPGKRVTEFDLSYQIPKLRDWLTFYAEGIAWDEPNPVAYPRRSAMNPGIYMPKIPKLNKLDLRAEGVYTDVPNYPGPGSYYSNAHYAQGYTNYGQIMGSWIGRQGRGIQASSTYWFSGLRKLQLGYRQQVTNEAFIRGGNLHDVRAQYDFPLGSEFLVTSSLQYERWNFPTLSATPRSNVAVSVHFSYNPRDKYEACAGCYSLH